METIYTIKDDILEVKTVEEKVESYTLDSLKQEEAQIVKYIENYMAEMQPKLDAVREKIAQFN